MAALVQQSALPCDAQADLFNAGGRSLVRHVEADPSALASESEMRALLRAWVARDCAAWSLAAEVLQANA